MERTQALMLEADETVKESEAEAVRDHHLLAEHVAEVALIGARGNFCRFGG